MFRGMYYRIFFASDVKNENGLRRFAERCISSLIDKVKKKSTSLRQKIQKLERQLSATKTVLDNVAKESLLSDNEFFGIQRRIRNGTLLIVGILFTEGLLNYFSTLVFISGEDFGIALLRWLIAIVLTFGAIGVSEKFIEAILPIQKHKGPDAKSRSTVLIILWSTLILGVEVAIAGVSEARARDIEGGQSGGLLYYGFIILSMVLPLIAGGISWDLLHFYDSYKHTRKYSFAQSSWNRLDQQIESAVQRLEDYYNVKLNGYWNRFNDFRSYKENCNKKKGITEILSDHFSSSFALFKQEADTRYGEIGGKIVHSHK
ncbi:MAG: hypothetical protein KGJ59_03615 [Bacteroidota bacterium]|nr:hypothetical protein [Bacteroidota bacterium]